MMRRSLLKLLPMVALVAAGCAEATFSAHTRDNSVEDIQRALARSKSPAAGARPTAYLVVNAGGGARELVAWDLAKGQLAWREKDDPKSRVYAGGGVVAYRTADGLVVRNAADGRALFTVRLGGERFAGAAADDDHVYYVVQSTGEGQRVSTVIALDHGGRELWRKPAQGSLGAPAARGGVVAVPFRYQNVSFLDGMDGKELARVRATDEQITFVNALPEGFAYGGNSGVYLFDEKSAAGSQKGSSFIGARMGEEGAVRPFYGLDAYQTTQTDYTAYDRNRLLWRLAPSQAGVSFKDDTIVVHSYRYFFAFGGTEGKSHGGRMRWVYAHPRVDVVASAHSGAAVLFASSDGTLGALDAKTGAVGAKTSTGLKIIGATFDADGWAPPAGPAPPVGALVQSLEQVISDPDARFVAVKVFAVDMLGDVPGTEATRALLKVVTSPPKKGVTPAVLKKAGDELVARKDGSLLPQYLEALATRYDYLAERAPQGLETLARVSAAVEAKEAGPLLAAHLLDPATPQPVLRDVAAALGVLGGKDGLRALAEFLATYRADPAFLTDPGALAIAGDALVRLGGAPERRMVAFAASDPRTLPPVAKALGKLLSDATAKAAGAKAR